MRVPFIDGFYEDASRGFDYQRCINLYPIYSESGTSKSQAHLVGTPGKRIITTVVPNKGAGCRGLYSTSTGRMFGVWGDTLYEINSAGFASDRNPSLRLSTLAGNVSMSDNGTQLIIVTGVSGYILTLASNVFQIISDADYPTTANQVIFHDSYFIVSVPNSKRFYISDINDGTSWNALDFASINSSPDNIIGLIRNKNDIWLFGEKSIEIWQNIGNADFPYLRVSNASQMIGTDNPWTIQTIKDSVYWLGSNKDGYGAVWRSEGYNSVIVSTDSINRKISEVGTRDDSIAYTYQENGHFFYVICVVGVGTFCYDATTNKWHERAYWSTETGAWDRDRANYHSFAFGKNYIGFSGDDKLYTLDPDYYLDGTDQIRRLRTGSHIAEENKQIRFNSVELEMARGVGLETGQGSDPQVMHRYSNDGGHTWSNEQWRSLGAGGNYKARARWMSQGTGRDRVLEFAVSDPVKVDMMDIYIDLELLGA